MKRTHWLILGTTLAGATFAHADLTRDATWFFNQVVSTVGARTAIFLTTDNDIAHEHKLENAISKSAGWATGESIMRESSGVDATPRITVDRADTSGQPAADTPSETFLRWLAGYDLGLSEQVKGSKNHDGTVKVKGLEQLAEAFPAYLGFVNTPVKGEQAGIPNMPTTAGQFEDVFKHLNGSLGDTVTQMGAFFTNKLVQGGHDLRCDPTFNDNLRGGLELQMLSTYPVLFGLPSNQNDPIDRIRWISNSFLPMGGEGHLYTVPTAIQAQAGHSTGHFRVLLPPPAQVITKDPSGNQLTFDAWKLGPVSVPQNMDSGPAHFSQMDVMARKPAPGQGYFPMIQVAFDKDYDKLDAQNHPDLNDLDVQVSLGELNLAGKLKTEDDCNRTDVFPIDMTNPEAALVIRGTLIASKIFPPAVAQQPVNTPPTADQKAKLAKTKWGGEIKKAEDEVEHIFKDEDRKYHAELGKIEGGLKMSTEKALTGTELAIVIHRLNLTFTRTKRLPIGKDGQVDFVNAKRNDDPFDQIKVKKEGMEASVIVYFSEDVPLYKLMKHLSLKADRNVLHCADDGAIQGLAGNDHKARCALRFDSTNDQAGDHVGLFRGLLNSNVMKNVIPQLAAAIEPQANQGLKQFDTAVEAAKDQMFKAYESHRSEIASKLGTGMEGFQNAGGKSAAPDVVSKQIQNLLQGELGQLGAAK